MVKGTYPPMGEGLEIVRNLGTGLQAGVLSLSVANTYWKFSQPAAKT